MRGDGPPQRILMTADTLGGVWDYALELTAGLARHGIQVTLATMGRRPSDDQRAQARQIAGASLVESEYRLEWMDDPWDDVDAAGEWLLSVMRDVRAEIVHLNGYAHAALPWTVPTLVVAHSCVCSWWAAVHGSMPPAEWSTYRDRTRRGLAAASAIVAPSHSMLYAVSAHHGPCQGTVIPNGRSARRFRATRKEPFVFSAGRLWDPAKNVMALSSAAPHVRWPIVVAGDAAPPDGRLHPPTGVTVLGRVSPADMPQWLGRASIYAMPARYEPFGLSILEAALSGCALVLGDIPSLREHWDGAALFVAPDDDAGLAHMVNDLIDHEDRRRSWARRARARGAEFTASRMAMAYERLYADMLSTEPAPLPEAACAS